MSYLYYILYSHLRKVKTNNTPAFNAMLMISTVQWMNVMVVVLVVNHFIKIGFLSSKDQSVLSGVTLGLMMYAVNFFFLYRRRVEISRRYGENGEGVNKIGVSILVIYLIGSFILVYFVGSRFPL